MTNWEKEKKYFDTVGIDRYDVPDNIINYLKQKPTKPVNNELLGHIKEEFGYQNVPDYVQRYFLEKTYFNRGVTQYTLAKDYESSIKDFNKAIEINPN